MPRFSGFFDPASRAARVAGATLLALPLVAALALGYSAWRQGMFERQHPYRLLAKSASGIRVGMPVEFSGFPIGSVAEVRLGDSGEAEIGIVVADRHLRWVRADSVFSLQQPLLGTPKIVVDTRELKNPILPAGSTRRLAAESAFEQMLAQAQPLLADLRRLTQTLADPTGPLARTLGHTEKIAGHAERLADRAAREGIVSAVTADPASGRDAAASIRLANETLARVNATIDHADRRLFAAGGVGDQVDAGLKESVAAVGNLREALQALTRVLGQGERAAANVAAGTEDIAALRLRVEQALHRSDEILKRVDALLAKPREAKLP